MSSPEDKYLFGGPQSSQISFRPCLGSGKQLFFECEGAIAFAKQLLVYSLLFIFFFLLFFWGLLGAIFLFYTKEDLLLPCAIMAEKEKEIFTLPLLAKTEKTLFFSCCAMEDFFFSRTSLETQKTLSPPIQEQALFISSQNDIFYSPTPFYAPSPINLEELSH